MFEHPEIWYVKVYFGICRLKQYKQQTVKFKIKYLKRTKKQERLGFFPNAKLIASEMK